jgi:hypothetical protein
MEGSLAVFNHCPRPQAEYYLLVPLAGITEEIIEWNIHFLADKLQFIDLTAAHGVREIATEMELARSFPPIWAGSADDGMKLIKLIYSLLPKVDIQDRMFTLTHLVSGFLAKLQARAFEISMRRDQFRKTLAFSMESSRDLSQRSFTIQSIPGLDLLEISEGRTRTNRRFVDTLEGAAEEARLLPEKISKFSNALTATAELEERKQERDKKKRIEAEKKAQDRLNLVLAAVAGLAAIPLIFGQYDVQSHLNGIGGWFPFGIGVQVTFLAGIGTLVGITIVMGTNYWKGKRASKAQRASPVNEVSRLSNTLFDCYRSYQHGAIRSAIFQQIRPNALYGGGGTWDDASAEEREAREMTHGLDKKLAETAALGMDRALEWEESDKLPDDDEAWVEAGITALHKERFAPSAVCGITGGGWDWIWVCVWGSRGDRRAPPLLTPIPSGRYS